MAVSFPSNYGVTRGPGLLIQGGFGGKSPLGRVPESVLLHAWEFLNAKDLGRISRACQSVRLLSQAVLEANPDLRRERVQRRVASAPSFMPIYQSTISAHGIQSSLIHFMVKSAEEHLLIFSNPVCFNPTVGLRIFHPATEREYRIGLEAPVMFAELGSYVFFANPHLGVRKVLFSQLLELDGRNLGLAELERVDDQGPLSLAPYHTSHVRGVGFDVPVLCAKHGLLAIAHETYAKVIQLSTGLTTQVQMPGITQIEITDGLIRFLSIDKYEQWTFKALFPGNSVAADPRRPAYEFSRGREEYGFKFFETCEDNQTVVIAYCCRQILLPRGRYGVKVCFGKIVDPLKGTSIELTKSWPRRIGEDSGVSRLLNVGTSLYGILPQFFKWELNSGKGVSHCKPPTDVRSTLVKVGDFVVTTGDNRMGLHRINEGTFWPVKRSSTLVLGVDPNAPQLMQLHAEHWRYWAVETRQSEADGTHPKAVVTVYDLEHDGKLNEGKRRIDPDLEPSAKRIKNGPL